MIEEHVELIGRSDPEDERQEPVRVGVAGVLGRTGSVIAGQIATNPEFKLVGGLIRHDSDPPLDSPYRLLTDPHELLPEIDVLIDLSLPSAPVYDLVATGFLPLTTAMIERLASMPFLPMAIWPTGAGQWTGIGLGDLLMAAVGPLVMRKAFGRTAGGAAMVLALGVIAGVMVVARWEALLETFPTMIVLGPVMVLHYLVWSHRSGMERTYAQYLADEPRLTAQPRLDISSRVVSEPTPFGPKRVEGSR